MDRISRLPIGILESILCFLPIQEAARTCILSKEWRYHWLKVPKLVFIEDTFQESTDGDELTVLEQTFDRSSERRIITSRCKLFYAIYQVLLRHQGPIHEFTLSLRADGSCVEIDHIILHLSNKNTIKKLKLDFSGIGSYMLPFSLFSLHQLTDLYLTTCTLKLQSSFTGFGSLTTLCLEDIGICQKELLRLLANCLSLRRLSLLSDGGTIVECQDCTIADLIECVPNIEYLSLTFFIFTIFYPLPKELSTRLVHLKYLCLEWVWFHHKYAVPFLVLLIKSSPNLEKLKLDLSEYDLFDESWTGSATLEDYPDVMFEHLNELEILHFGNEDNELVVVRLILAKSPVLKTVKILVCDEFDEDDKLQISEGLLSFQCASPVVRIIVS
ncbi:F-box/FBD/LRR-repeat protein At1g13570-like [Bidens hawaiensis]|uniref:F-box/FBD/LRR-repeat protein At1g13570-like n=1 Tax=Bidens hawaiensis TaxID=980011 RepID=UPI00404A8F81